MIEFRNQEPVKFEEIKVGDLITYRPFDPIFGYFEVHSMDVDTIEVALYRPNGEQVYSDFIEASELEEAWRVTLWPNS